MTTLRSHSDALATTNEHEYGSFVEGTSGQRLITGLTRSERQDSASVVSYPVKLKNNEDVNGDGGSAQTLESESAYRPAWWQRIFQRSQLPLRRIPFRNKNQRHGLLHHSIRNHGGGRTEEMRPLVDCSLDFNDTSDKAVHVAAIFLRDYEVSRPPTLPVEHGFVDSIPDTVLRIHHLRFSKFWRTVKVLALVLVLATAGFEGPDLHAHLSVCLTLNCFAFTIFFR